MKIFAVLSLVLASSLAHADLPTGPICEDAPANRMPMGAQIKFTEELIFGKGNVARVKSDGKECVVSLRPEITNRYEAERNIPANVRTSKIHSVTVLNGEFLQIKLADEVLSEIVCPADAFEHYRIKDVVKAISGFAEFQEDMTDCTNPANNAIPTGSEGGGSGGEGLNAR